MMSSSNVIEFDGERTRRYLNGIFVGYLKDPATSDYQRGFLAAALVIYREGLGRGADDDRLALLDAQISAGADNGDDGSFVTYGPVPFIPRQGGVWVKWSPDAVIRARLCTGIIYEGPAHEFNLNGANKPTTIVELELPLASADRSGEAIETPKSGSTEGESAVPERQTPNPPPIALPSEQPNDQ
jgi:hypothetical protein